ncbi:MAG TPA: HAMP domain-containing sensor histidine kinase [Chloroflexia bacterium]|nr:HAMP domain-containing sensor histidine kinase [Chloroflexia bacterium]
MGVQLSVIYAVLLAGVLTLLGFVLYSQLDKFMVQNTAARLNRVTQPVLARPFFARDEAGTYGFPSLPSQGNSGPEGRRRPLSVEQDAALLVRSLSTSNSSVAVLDAEGTIITSTQSALTSTEVYLPSLPDDWKTRVATGNGMAQWEISEAGHERSLVVVTLFRPASQETIIVTNGQTVDSDNGAGQVASGVITLSRDEYYVEQVASLGAADDILNQLRLYLMLGIVFGTIVGVMCGLWLTRMILRPLDKLAGTAEAIAAGDLRRRVRFPFGRNEVARVGGAFDHMVDRIAENIDSQQRFVADASHELRTPLTSLEGLSEMLLIGADRGDERAMQRTVRAMYGELGRMSRLVADLLTLSRLDSSVPLALHNVDVGRLLREIADQMTPIAEGKDVRLVVSSQEQSVVQAEPDRLRQVVLNLVDNAVRFAPPGTRVQLSARRDPAHNQVLIEVEDQGPGIPREDLPHIFDRFYRGDPSRARATGNSGLGLAIAQAIVQAHGGTLSAVSSPGNGAHFTIALPVGDPGSVHNLPLYDKQIEQAERISTR